MDASRLELARAEVDGGALQEVADAVKEVIDLEPGTRTAQTLVSRMAGGIEQKFADSKVTVKAEWMDRSGFGDYK